MSQKLVSRNPDLSRLRADGYNVAVGKGNCLIVRDVPFVNSNKEVKTGILVCDLDLAGDATVAPREHVAFFVGEYPCNIDGTPIAGVSANANKAYDTDLLPNHQLSRKPTAGETPGRYKDYYEKVTTCVDIISSPALALKPGVTARTSPVVVPDEGESVFNYLDTGATKAGIVMANDKLATGKVAIVGVGGTGSYVLDLVAKSPVSEIHIFDRDGLLNHNAFRSPGAPSVDDLEKKPEKVEYFAAIYSKIRKGIFPHNFYIDETTVEHLKGMSFVFLCVDKGVAKRLIVERLEEWGIPFIDVGMGIQLGDDNALGGIVALTTCTPAKRDHVRNRIAFSDGEADNEYSRDIQIADLSALSAALAVIKWKKHCGYYRDFVKEHWCAYSIDANNLASEDRHEG